MKKFISIIILMFAVFVPQTLAQASKTPQGEVAMKYLTFIKDGKYAEAVNMMVMPDSRRADFVELLRYATEENRKKNGEIVAVHIDKVEHAEGSKSAKVYYTMTFKNGKKDSDVINMKDTSGQWKIN